MSLPARLGVGPLSPEIVEAAYRWSHKNVQRIMLIASRNQVDWDGGYTGWDTESYTAFCRDLGAKYPDAKVELWRDHCGLGFREDDSLSAVYRTLQADLEQGWDGIHLDFCKVECPSQRFQETAQAIKFISRRRPETLLELGTEENGTGLDYAPELRKTVEEFRKLCAPLYYVVRTGTKVMAARQVGELDKTGLIPDCAKMLWEEYRICLKEHNSDWLTDSEIRWRKERGVYAMNVAPQFGSLQTETVLSLATLHGIDPGPWIDEVYMGGRWQKWVDPQLSGPVGVIKIAGHYHYQSPKYWEMTQQLTGAGVDLQETLVTAAERLIGRYMRGLS